MWGTFSGIMSGIHMKRMEKECVAPLNPKLHKQYVDDTITKRKKNAANDRLFANMNFHHQNIKLILETNPATFLNTAHKVNPDGSVKIKVFWNPGKFSAFWNHQIPKGYETDNVDGDLHWAFKIAFDLDAEISTITRKYLDNRYLIGVFQTVINDFKKKTENQLIITDWLFEERSKFSFKLPCCPSNEPDVIKFIERIKSFTGGKVTLIVLWSTKNINLLMSKLRIDLAWIINDNVVVI